MNESRIAFIGGGNMARALIGGLLRAGLQPGAIAVGEPAAAARAALAADFGIEVHADNAAALRGATLVVLAVKPQDMAVVLAPLALQVQLQRSLVLSIAAGLTLHRLGALCGPGVSVVRAMPNRPALVGAGATGLCAGPVVSAADRDRAAAVMQTAGNVVWIEDEALMDAVTAVSGSGPAYFFLLAEALAEAGVAQGLPRDTARRLATATLAGAGRMAEDPAADMATLRAEVTSRGGTTEAALRAMEQHGFRATVAAAVAAATERGRTLGAAPPAAASSISPDGAPDAVARGR